MTRFYVGRTPRMRLSLARHEAAHAVIAMHLGIRVCAIEIFDKPQPGKLGGKTGKKLAECSMDLRYRQGPLRFSVIAMAGPAADHIMSRTVATTIRRATLPTSG